MHLTFAFILTLLSAPTVLAQGVAYPYAGYRIIARREFSSTTAVFIVPFIWWNCNQGLGQQAFIMGGIADPLTCDNRGIEAGVSILCTPVGFAYQAYWKRFPHRVNVVNVGRISIGDVIRVEIKINWNNIRVLIENETTGLSTGYLPAGTQADITPGPRSNCRRIVTWGLRVNRIRGNTDIWPPPSFRYIFFRRVEARDRYNVMYGVQDASRLIMRDFYGFVWATPERYNSDIDGPAYANALAIWP